MTSGTQRIFSWFFLCSIAYVRATSRRCTWCRRLQRGHEYNHSGRDSNHLERPGSLLHSSKKQSNSEVEVVLWFLEQALRFDGKQMQVLLVFPEDLGGSATEGPATIWDSVEVRSLSGLSDAQRGSAFMCDLTGADQRRPLEIFTNITSLITRTYPGWPSLRLQGNTELIYEGPLPPSCQCLPAHSPIRGLNEHEEFRFSSSLAFGKQFWWYTAAPCLQYTGLRNEGLPSSCVQGRLRGPFSVTTVALPQLLCTLRAHRRSCLFLAAAFLPFRRVPLLAVHCRRLLALVVLCARPWWHRHRGEMFRMALLLCLA